MVTAICSGDEVDFEESFKSPFLVDLELVRPSILDPEPEKVKFMCIYNKLIKSPKFKKLFVDTFGESESLHVKFELTNEGMEGVGGTTSGTKKYVNGTVVGLDLLIKIKKSNLDSSSPNAKTPINIARDILHECIHAFLITKMYNCDTGTSLEQINDMLLSELINEYYDGACIDEEEQHEFMFDYLLPVMEQILHEIKDDMIPLAQQEYLESNDYYDTSNPNNTLTDSHPFDFNLFFYYMSIEGLHQTQSVIDFFASNQTQKYLYDKYRTEANNLSKNCNE